MENNTVVMRWILMYASWKSIDANIKHSIKINHKAHDAFSNIKYICNIQNIQLKKRNINHAQFNSIQLYYISIQNSLAPLICSNHNKKKN